MDLLIFERKHRTVENYKRPVSVPIGKYYGILEGDQVIVSDLKASDDLNAFGCYGEFLQRREPRISMECFENNHQQQQQERYHFKISLIDPDHDNLNGMVITVLCRIYVTVRKIERLSFLLMKSGLFFYTVII
uniref:Cadherin domain-containing protein n=1 Tax=Elaeophora elaphi TaxID=1147741 RepID=A0A0R3RRM8_9BILA